MVHSSIASRGFYTGELRPVLEHLLAARLAERHGVHLYQDPDAARRLLCRRPRDADLWRWIEPIPKPPEGAQPETRGPSTGFLGWVERRFASIGCCARGSKMAVCRPRWPSNAG